MDSTYSLLSALKGQQRQMETISNNLANINTPGFKKDQALFREYYNLAIGQDLESEEEKFAHGEFISPYNRGSSSYAMLDSVSPQLHRGDLRVTDNPYDLAIQTDGYFVVDTVQGLRYTRNGQFLRDGQGYLITTNGDRILGQKGPIKIEGQHFTVGSQGRILVDRKEIDQLRVVTFERPAGLTRMGNSYWAPGGTDQKPIASNNHVIQQGTIEMSNVDSIQELVKMITVNRSYQAAQRAIRSKDDLDSKSISVAKL